MKTTLQEGTALVTRLSCGGVSLSGGMEAPTIPTQEKSAIPTEQKQTIFPDTGFMLSAVTVDPIPPNYGKITWNGVTLTVS
jgi:hypothetical protein